jgi:hypothetical protein
MGDSDKPHPATAKVPRAGTALLILGTIADTTWRMFVPPLALLAIAMIYGGEHKLAWALAAVVLGFALAIALVYVQYKKIRRAEESKQS